MNTKPSVIITGGAGYLGSFLTGELLRQGYAVTVIDDLLYGGDSLTSYLNSPDFKLVKANVWEPRAVSNTIRKAESKPFAIMHMAGIVGFPACQSVGRQAAWRYNVEATQQVFETANEFGIERFIYPSTYSTYGNFAKVEKVTEETPLNPQSLYAETKAAAERLIFGRVDSETAPVVFRLANVYGISPRTRFDVIVNQFVYEAYFNRDLLIYQKGYSRSFIHIKDVVNGLVLGLTAEIEKVRGEVFNLGDPEGSLAKDEVASLILKRLPETTVRYKNLTFGGDMRDITLSMEKITNQLGFKATMNISGGVKEVLHAIRSGLIRNPHDERFRNARFIVQ